MLKIISIKMDHSIYDILLLEDYLELLKQLLKNYILKMKKVNNLSLVIPQKLKKRDNYY